MKTILIVYSDESCFEVGKNSRQTHCDVSIIRFFGRLRAEKNKNLYFLKLYRKKINQSRLNRLDHLRFDMIVCYPSFPEIEYYAEKRGVLYFNFAHFSQNSTYFDTFWLSNNNTIRDFENVAGQSSLHPGTLSPLTSENAYYSQFLPLPHKGSNIFYKKDKILCLTLVDDAFNLNDESDLVRQLKAVLNDNSHLFGDDVALVLYGREKKLLDRVAVRVRGKRGITVHVVHNLFRFNENLVYSMMHKSDCVFSWRNGLGVDAIVLQKPVIFLGDDDVLFNQLNSLVTDPHSGAELSKLGQRQHEYLRNFVFFLEQNDLFIPNIRYDIVDFIKLLSKVDFSSAKKKYHEDQVGSSVFDDNNGEKAIVAAYIDGSQKAKNFFFASLRKKEAIVKKINKLLRDPRAFFLDSKSPLLRFLGSLL